MKRKKRVPAGRPGMRPIHPGEILGEELKALNLSARAFASAIQVPVNRVTQILNGQRAVSADTALRLQQFFGTSAEFWLGLQTDYELRKAEIAVGKRISESVGRHAA